MTIHSPASEDEVRALVCDAAGRAVPLAVAGGATKHGVGRPAQTQETLSTRGLSGVTLYEPAELVIGARAGTPLAEVEATLAEKGQRLAFEPADWRALLGTEGEPTIGAVAAANVSGPRRIMVGAARDALIGVRFVNGRGEAVKNGGRVMKNVTGLDLVKTLAGSWGTLAILTEVTFKVLPIPQRTATLVYSGLDDTRAVTALCAALGSPFEVTGAAHVPGDGGGAGTLIRIEGFEASVRYRLGELKSLLAEYGEPGLVEDADGEALWRGVRDVAPLVTPPERAVWKISTAPSRGPALAAAIGAQTEARWLYDWGGGLVWLAAAADEAATRIVREATRAHRGHATLVRAPADLRAAVDVFEPLPEAMMRLTKGLKASFDPKGIFEPGRMYAGV
ncbi:glycolate oxidase subunit GlcE [Salinarimonas rosea]|uniref:glycolate oxidase subunit GlcE n=1 Tax=Salinarimonas rosea TaxID=552063 RepID=UPI00040BAE2C|nr:glycolate oxidase subunit GlcE [Salinarimonas rosea]